MAHVLSSNNIWNVLNFRNCSSSTTDFLDNNFVEGIEDYKGPIEKRARCAVPLLTFSFSSRKRICIVFPEALLYGHTYSKSVDQLGKVANPARGQLNRENEYQVFPCPRWHLRIWSRETGSAVPFRVSLLISILGLNLVLTYGIPPEFRGGVHLFVLTAIRHRVSPEFIGSCSCVPMGFAPESPPAQGR